MDILKLAEKLVNQPDADHDVVSVSRALLEAGATIARLQAEVDSLEFDLNEWFCGHCACNSCDEARQVRDRDWAN